MKKQITTSAIALMLICAFHSASAATTVITLSGNLSARDLAENSDLKTANTIDLSEAAIVEYSDKEPIVGNYTYYPADELPKYCFMGIAAETIILPSSIKVVGEGAFAGCENLKSIVIPSAVTEIDSYAFSGCKSLATVGGGENIITIGDYAFSGNTSLTSLPCFAKVESIGGYAFKGCTSLGSVPFSVTTSAIGEGAFKGCPIASIDLGGCNNLKVTGAWAFADNSALTEVYLPSGLTSLGDGAFFYSTALQSVVFPEGLAKINDYAFMGGSLISEATLPDGLESIGNYAFSDWGAIGTISLPSTLTTIGERAMRNWTSLSSMTCDATVPPTLGDNVWEGVSKDRVTLNVPVTSEALYKSAEQWCDFFNSSSTEQLSSKLLTATINGDVLTLKSSLEITSVMLYDMSGILLTMQLPMALQAQLSLANYSARNYVVRCTFGDNNVEIIKIAR